MHCSRRLIVQTLVFSHSYLHLNYLDDEFCLKIPDFHVKFRDLLHAVNLRRGTNGFTSLPKEGVLRIFSPWKIRRRLRPGLNPRTWVPKASTLPLDHRSRFYCAYFSVLSCDGRPYHIIVFSQRHLWKYFMKTKEEMRIKIECVCSI